MHLFHLLPRFVPSFISLYLTSNPSSTLTPPTSLPHCRLLDTKYMKRKACQRRAFIGKHKTLHSKHHDAKQQERHGQKATEQMRTPRPANPDLNPKSTKLHTPRLLCRARYKTHQVLDTSTSPSPAILSVPATLSVPGAPSTHSLWSS